MKREEKKNFVENLKTILSENSLVLVFHYRGMSMTDMTDLRVQSFNAGCNIVLHCNGNLREMQIVARNSPKIDNFILKKTSQLMKIIG